MSIWQYLVSRLGTDMTLLINQYEGCVSLSKFTRSRQHNAHRAKIHRPYCNLMQRHNLSLSSSLMHTDLLESYYNHGDIVIINEYTYHMYYNGELVHHWEWGRLHLNLITEYPIGYWVDLPVRVNHYCLDLNTLQCRRIHHQTFNGIRYVILLVMDVYYAVILRQHNFSGVVRVSLGLPCDEAFASFLRTRYRIDSKYIMLY